MALDTVADYVSAARVLLQDTYAGAYRYSDAELVNNLNFGIMEATRIRPDMFLKYPPGTVPSYTASAMTATVDIPMYYRMAFMYYMTGQAQLRDEENTQDARAAVFLNKFVSQLQVAAS